MSTPEENQIEPNTPTISNEEFNSDHSVIFIKETHKVKYKGTVPVKKKKPTTNERQVPVKRIQINKPPPEPSKYIPFKLTYLHSIHIKSNLR